MTQMEVYKLDGIKDLPIAVRVPFAKAWLAEHNGDNELAATLLDAAVQAEQDKLNSK
jgi:hypothetical protein